MKHKISTNKNEKSPNNWTELFNKPFSSYIKEKKETKLEKMIRTLNELVEWSTKE